MSDHATFLQRIVSWIFKIVFELRKHLISVLVIGMVYLMFWNFPQTNDLLLVLNQPKEHFREMLFFFTALTVLAFLISNLNDYLNGNSLRSSYVPRDSKEKAIRSGLETEYELEETEEQYLQRLLPKVLGTLLLLITAFAVEHTFHTITDKVIFAGAAWGLGGFLLLLLLSLNQHAGQWFSRLVRKYDKKGRITMGLAISCLLIIIVLGFFNRGGSDEDIVRLFWAFLLLAVFFFIVSVSYSKLVLEFKARIGVFLIGSLTVLAFVLYLIFLVSPRYSQYLNPLTVILICLIGLFSVAQVIRIAGIKLNIPLLPLLVLILFVWGGITAAKKDFDHYEVSHTSPTLSVHDRPDLEDHIRSWLDDRREEIEDTQKFPVIFVAAEGGGSRAGLWSFLIHSKLYETNRAYFESYLFAMTGASGGNVGNTMFYNAAYDAFLNEKKVSFKASGPYKYKASIIYDDNYLSSSLAAVLGRDLAESIFGIFNFDDRADLLEKEWSKRYADTFRDEKTPSLNREFLSLMPGKKESEKTPPILLVNTTHLQTGNYSVISPVNLQDNALGTDVFRDFLENYQRASERSGEAKAIKITTAMLLNARFPYVSPVGRVPGVGQYGDAGYYDNVGGTLTTRLIAAFEKVVNQEYQDLKPKLDIRVMMIRNITQPKIAKDTLQFSSQLLAPPKMAVNAIFAHPEELFRMYGEDYMIESKRTPIRAPLDTTEIITPILPLGRYLSGSAILSLEARLENDTVQSRLESLLQIKKIKPRQPE